MGTFCVEGNEIRQDGRMIARIRRPDCDRWEDVLSRKDEHVWEWNRTIWIKKGRNSIENIEMGILLCRPADFYMIPCINYAGNFWGEGKEPRGMYRDGEPWRFAGHRCGVPAGMYGQNADAAVGLFAAVDNPVGVCAELTREAGSLCMTLHFPEEEGPVVYCARDSYEEEAYRESCRLSNDKITLHAFLVLSGRCDAYDYGFFLDAAWNMFSEVQKPCLDRDAVWQLGIRFVKNSIFFRQPGFTGFCMGLSWNGNRWEQKRDYLEIGWVGQNASLAVSLLYQSVFAADEEAFAMGLEVLDCWADRGPLPNGLFRCRFDRILQYGDNRDNREERNDAVNLYSVVVEYLEAYHLLKALGTERENYRALALAVCDFVAGSQKKDGRLAKAWYNDGVCSDEEGTVGCYLAEALCAGWKESGREDFLHAAERAFAGYFGEFMTYGYTTAGALDTCCVDKESAIPLLRTALALYHATGKGDYLKAAEEVSYYLASWQYHYNVVFSQESVLGQIGYRTRGGTAVSVQHHHLDCYGLEIYEAWKELARLTGHGIWRERGEAVWVNSLQNISDGSLVIKGQTRPAGSQDEGFLQTRWHTKRGDYFGVSEWLVTWNTAFRLKILRREAAGESFLARIRQKDKEEGRI